ncbi:hypothetical protein BJF78_28625 [Pseudonocardia sp. CNS-139]|nr:hypothetical protein BJF78_28625 [Pseudonocardia sp. CNS-139]
MLWSAVLVAVSVSVAPGDAAAAARAGLVEALTASSELWYFLALALYFPLARLTRRVPPAVQLGVAAVAFVLTAGGVVRTGSWGADHVLQLYVFFLAGLHLRPAVLARARRASAGRCLLLAVLWAGLAALIRFGTSSGSLVFVVLPPVGVLLVIELAALLGERGWLRGLRRIGRATLPVYVLHPLLLLVAGAALAGVRVAGLPLPVQAAAVAAATALVAAASLAVGRLLVRVPWLVGLPRRR